jgi:tRNA (guanine-N7-)-methyltransferase
MGRSKLQRFEENKTLENLFQPSYDEVKSGFFLKGKWRSLYFKNNNPIVLELGCGKGEYTVALAEKYPNKNFVGVDIKGSRLWVGCKRALSKDLKNTAFIRRHISIIDMLFDKEEVDEIWITFPDPHLREREAKRRLTSPEFITRYNRILKPHGIIHLKTDSSELYNYTKQVVEEHQLTIVHESADVYAQKLEGPVTEIQTYYESMWLEQGLSIKYISFIPLSHIKPELDFYERVWDITRQIPKGRVTSYGAIAKYLSSTGSARMVGWALTNCKNHVPPVPAHRVVNRNGQLTGKFHFEGLHAMQQLLEAEGVKISNDKVVDFDRLFWEPVLQKNNSSKQDL